MRRPQSSAGPRPHQWTQGDFVSPDSMVMHFVGAAALILVAAHGAGGWPGA